VDRYGSVYVSNPSVTIKYDRFGTELWRATGGQAIALDDSANVYVTGAWEDSIWTNKYDSSGTLVWHLLVGGTRIESDHSGDFIFHNPLRSPGMSGKITRNGVVEWIQTDLTTDDAFGFCVDAFGNSYVSGVRHAFSPARMYTTKRSPAGEVDWTAEYAVDDVAITPRSCFVDDSGILYVVGTGQKNDFSNVASIVKYAQIPVSVKEDDPGTPLEFSLSQNYPNPFNPTTTIRFAIPAGSGQVATSLQVYNLLGQEVATLVNEEMKPGSYAVQFDGSNLASGVYFYRLQAGDFTQARRLLLLK
jgi:hypothetical protein